MSNNFTGTVDKVFEKNGRYSIASDSVWYGCGFDKPNCEEGDTVSFNFTVRGNFKNIDMKSFSVQKQTASVASSGGDAPNRQDTISYQSARKDALQLAEILVSSNNLVLSNKKGEGADQIIAFIDSMTMRYFEDTGNLGHIDEFMQAESGSRYEGEE